MVFMSPVLFCLLPPLVLVIPAYIFGRKLLLKGVPQNEMHTTRRGQLFTLLIFVLYIVLMVLLYLIFIF